MLNHWFPSAAAQRRLREGPLCPHIDGFANRLRRLGYARSTGRWKLQLVAHLSRWLERRRLGARDLDEARVAAFLRYRQRRARSVLTGPATLCMLLEHLREESVVVPAPRPTEPFGSVLDAFRRYLECERGLSARTLAYYPVLVRLLLAERFGTRPFVPGALRPKDVARCMLRYAHRTSPRRAQLLGSALRAFFRFLEGRGDITGVLADSVPSVADWRLSTLPKALEPKQVERLLRACDRRGVPGRRDYALLLLLARLGLRAGEVVALTMDDLDWRAGEVVVRGKGGARDRLPLPKDVGEALVDYLRHDRPRVPTRRVFLRCRAPLRGFASSAAICDIVRRALERAGLDPPRKGAHLLRHGLALRMQRRGASLAEIGEVLRHRLAQTTEIYTKTDLKRLRALARPWPGGAQ